MSIGYFGIHNHTHYSNERLKDCINKPEDLINKAQELGLNGIAITDHETLSAHIKVQKYINDNKDKFKGFKIAFGNEIYLVNRELINQQKENNERIAFNHFLLVAKNKHGYEFLRKQSTQAWKNSFFYRGLERVPTYYDWLIDNMKDYKGDVIASTACLGGELPRLLIELDKHEDIKIKKQIDHFIKQMIAIFGKDDFYFELQPSEGEEQKVVNKWLLKLSKAYGIKAIITTDTHYLTKEQKLAHKIFLQSQEGDREVDSFYDTTYLFSVDDLKKYFDEEVLNQLIANTNEIRNKIDEYSLEHKTIIPKAHIPKFDKVKLSQINNNVDWNQYPYIQKYEQSQNKSDQYYIKCIFDGMYDKKQTFNDINLSRINTELSEVWAISEYLKQPMSAYFLSMKEFVNIMWKVSLVGISRGSASCFYTNYLLDIVQINAIKFNLPHWRFLTKERIGSWPDIDIDSENSKRLKIIELVKGKFGEDAVLNLSTFTTEKPRSSVLDSCRGLGLSIAESQNIVDLIPNDNGVEWSLHDAFYGNNKKNRKPCTKFIEAVRKVPNLKEVMLGIEGVISGRSQHASGVVVFDDGYINHNAMMKTTGGLAVTQYDAHDTEYAGGIKYDFLTTVVLDRIHETINLLLKDNKIQWQGSLKKTYLKYFNPDELDLTSSEMYDLLFKGDVTNAFQFESLVGRKALEKVNCRSFDEICAANSLMRLSSPNGEQPLDKYIRFKNNINEWYQEMNQQGLKQEEQQTLIKLLSSRYGICDTQEYLMQVAMDKHISGYSLLEANKLRKAIAKKNEKLQEEQKKIFYKKGLALGTRKIMLNYVWNNCIEIQRGYAFSLPHIVGYSLELMLEMNICLQYGSIYWKTACLTINAGINQNSGANYAKISEAITEMNGLVIVPDINKSEMGFKPFNDHILYGLGSIVGINEDDVNCIINNRPYSSFDEFINKTNLSSRKVIILIKSGCFDNICDKSRKQLMIYYIDKITPRKQKLTTVQIPKIKELIPAKYQSMVNAYEFKQKLNSKNNKNNLEQEFKNNYLPLVALKVKKQPFNYDNKGMFILDKNTYNKWFNDYAKPLKEWLKTSEAINIEARLSSRELWKKYCLGNKESWEMETLNFYANKHELDLTPLKRQFNISNFSELPKEPQATAFRTYKGRKYPIINKVVISGTVIDKDKRGLIYIITQDKSIAIIRINKKQYGYFNKKTVVGTGKNRKVIDGSWFDRGTKLVCVGYRRGKEFIANNKNTPFNHALMKVNGYGNNIIIQTEK